MRCRLSSLLRSGRSMCGLLPGLRARAVRQRLLRGHRGTLYPVCVAAAVMLGHKLRMEPDGLSMSPAHPCALRQRDLRRLWDDLRYRPDSLR